MDSRDLHVKTLDRSECLALLARATVGRVGVSIGALPAILPVHFALFDESVLFWTVLGTKLDAATVGSVVAFEVDSYEPHGTAGWSILIQGIASEITDLAVLARISTVPLRPWAGEDMVERLIGIEIARLNGRMFLAGEGASRASLPPLSGVA